MKSTYSIKEAQSKFVGIVHEAEGGKMVTITRHEKAVAFILGADDLDALIETIEILADPVAMKAIADAKAGRGKLYSIDDIKE
jgi:prevent-host-death family protein